MKKTLLLALFALVFTKLNAQDIITKQNGDEIQTKVIEINDNEVKYKAFDNLDGPLYVVKKSDIFMIKYQNGKKDVFKNNTATVNNDLKDNTTVGSNADFEPQNENIAFISYTKYNKAYLNGKKLTKEELEELYQKNNNEQALNLLETGYSKINTSNVLACIGIPMLAGSIPLYLFGSSTGMIAIGYVLDLVGTTLCITAIGVGAAGKARVCNSFREYNNSIARRQNNVSLNFGIVNNGIGVALRF